MSMKLQVMLTEMLAILYLIAAQLSDGILKWILIIAAIENMLEGAYFTFKARKHGVKR